MKHIILDTCVILHILRANPFGLRCLQIIEEFGEDVSIIISVVTKAELESLKIQQLWGANRIKQLNTFLEAAICIDINSSDTVLLESYSKIDAYSKRKGTDKNGDLLAGSARVMGKNDLWIAATASSLNIPLMTADGDFNHLKNSFIQIIEII